MVRKKMVNFVFKAAQSFDQVKLCGSFSDWEQGGIFMEKGKSGEWKAKVPLDAGEHEYKFWADGVWFNDPAADKLVSNDWGSENSVRVVR